VKREVSWMPHAPVGAKKGIIIIIIYLQLVIASNCNTIVNSHSAIHYSTNLSLLSLL
jgi:hypothetical protein